MAVGIALLFSQPTMAFADSKRGSEAFSRGDYTAANHEWRESAEAGDASAILGVGLLYDTGHGEPQDFAQALSWYRRAAEAGDAHAMFNVGAMYDNGRGTAMDRREAVRWYAKSAAKGNGRAAYAAATLYRDGDGVPQNTAAAIKFFKLAAAAGIGAARLNLASLGQGASSAAVASVSRPPGVTPKTADSAAATAQNPSAAQATTADFAAAKSELPRAAAKPSSPDVASSNAPASNITANVPPSATTNGFAVAAGSIPIIPTTPSGPPQLQVMGPGAPTAEALTTGIERFHKLALQRAIVSAALSKQYEGLFSELVRKAIEGDEVAQYDAAFAYERGIGTPPDLVVAYVYYIRAALSPEMGLKSAALRGAFEAASRLTDAQQAFAADMLMHGVH